MRRPHDIRIVTVIAAFDESVEADDVDYFMENVIGLRWSGWPSETFVWVIREIARRMPDEDFKQLVDDAKEYIEEIAAVSLEHEYEVATGNPCTGDGFRVWLAERTATNRVQQVGVR